MRTSKFSESQIVGMLREAESGVPVADLLRRHGVSKATFFKWRNKYAGASIPIVKRLRELEVENCTLKRTPTWRSSMRRSRMCSPEHCMAVSDTGGAGSTRAGTSSAGATGLSYGEALAGGV